MVKYWCIGFLLFCFCSAYAQNYQELFNSSTIDKHATEALSLHLESEILLYNEEFFHPLYSGRTIPAFYLKPGIQYQFHPRFALRGGGHTYHFFGDSLLHKRMWLQALWSPIDSLYIRFGELDHGPKHGLPEAILSRERYYMRPYEQGVQLQIDKSSIALDAWLDWQQFLRPQHPRQERFTGALKVDWAFWRKPDKKLELLTYGQIQHVGGQFDTMNLPVLNHFAAYVGARYAQKIGNHRLIPSLRYFYSKSDLRPTWTAGQAYEARLRYAWKGLNLSASYWYSTHMLVPNGLAYFGNYIEGLGQAMPGGGKLQLEASYSHTIGEGIQFHASSDLYYDLPLAQMDYRFYLGIVLDRRWRLWSRD